MLLDIGVYVRRDCQMAEVVDELTQVAADLSVAGNLAHGEVSTAERHTLGVDADEYLGDGLNVEILSKCDDANLGLADAGEAFECLFYGIRI